METTHDFHRGLSSALFSSPSTLDSLLSSPRSALLINYHLLEIQTLKRFKRTLIYYDTNAQEFNG